MRILLAGPKVCTPWTEGRKRFMRDLAAALGRHHEVRVVTTIEHGQSTQFDAAWQAPVARGGVQHLLRYHRSLSRMLDTWAPDFVCHIPISSFHGRYRYGNFASIWWTDRQCARRGVPCLTLMYAIMSETTLQGVARWARHLLANRYTAGGPSIRFGVDLPVVAQPAARASGRRLLFMAGMSEPTRERLDYVLTVRGLTTLLAAGKWLAPAGFTLTIAIPLLSYGNLAGTLQAFPENTWPAGSLDLRGEVAVPGVYADHDVFVFPYGRDEPQFVPTSVIEAMHWGLPVALPAHPFLLPLIRKKSTALAFQPNDPADLAAVLMSAIGDDDRLQALRENAHQFVQQEFNIAGTCDDLVGYFEKLNATENGYGHS
jgi:glycosyltransferase involved in cell wall biosynthesis